MPAVQSSAHRIHQSIA